MEMEVETPQREKRKSDDATELCIHCGKEARFTEDIAKYKLISEFVESHYFCSTTCQSKYYEWELRRDGETEWVYTRRLFFMRQLAKKRRVIELIEAVQRVLGDELPADMRKLILFNIVDTMSTKYARTESGRLAAAEDHVLFIGMRDTLFVDGLNHEDQLGSGVRRGYSERQGAPIAIRIPGVFFVATCSYYSAVITKNDDTSTTLWVTGRLVYSPNFGVPVFTRIEGISDAIAVNCVSSSIQIVLKDGTLWSCQTNDIHHNMEHTALIAPFVYQKELDGVISLGISGVIKNDSTVWRPSGSTFRKDTGLQGQQIICISERMTSITMTGIVLMKKDTKKELNSILGTPAGIDKDTDIVWFYDADYGNIGLSLCINRKNGATSLRRHYILQRGGLPLMDIVGNSDNVVCVKVAHDNNTPYIHVLKEDGSYWHVHYGGYTSKAPISLTRVSYLAPLVIMIPETKRPRCTDCKSSAYFSAHCMSTGNVLHHCKEHYHAH